MMQPYGIAKDVLIEHQDSLTLVDFMVVDMDPCQQTFHHPREALPEVNQSDH
jgi:hypothetical protein